MRHYEVTFIVHPDQSDQAKLLIEKYSTEIKDSKGVIHRIEDIGLRKLAYPIQDQFKGHYILMNIECNQDTIVDIKSSFKFNDSIIRELIVTKNSSEEGESSLMKVTKLDQEREKEKERERESYEREKSSYKKTDGIKKEKKTDSIKEVSVDKKEAVLENQTVDISPEKSDTKIKKIEQ